MIWISVISSTYGCMNVIDDHGPNVTCDVYFSYAMVLIDAIHEYCILRACEPLIHFVMFILN